MTNEQYLVHFGTKGQKWGLRRFQNPDGTYTEEGKARRRVGTDPETGKRVYYGKSGKAYSGKQVAAGLAAGVTIAVAAAYVAEHPETVKKVDELGATQLSKVSAKTKELGKQMVKQTVEGFKEGLKEAPKTAGKAIATGIVLNAAKRASDQAFGKNESDKIWKANNKKKIGSFWQDAIANKRDEDE